MLGSRLTMTIFFTPLPIMVFLAAQLCGTRGQDFGPFGYPGNPADQGSKPEEPLSASNQAERVDQLNAFLEAQAGANLLEGTANGTANSTANPACTPDIKFAACCTQIGMDSTITNIPDLIKAACHYEPKLSELQKVTLGYYFNEYIMCYADARDNSACCDKAGVPSKASWGFWSADCRDFCRGNHHMVTAGPGYRGCDNDQTLHGVAGCNKAANNMQDDTAAMKYQFCKDKDWCGAPMQWQQMCK